MTHLVAHELSKYYATPTGPPLEVLSKVTLTLAAGESAAIVGPSGSGKSTLLAILGTLDPPTSGTLSLADADPFQMPKPQLATFRSQHIGFVFQQHHLLPQCTVMENVLIPFLSDGKAGPEEIARAEKLLDRVGLVDRQTHRPSQLSGGEQQRVALARAMVRGPTILLADEPTGNLDRSSAEMVAQLLLDLQKEHNTVLVVATHSMTLAEKLQRRYELDNGTLTAAG